VLATDVKLFKTFHLPWSSQFLNCFYFQVISNNLQKISLLSLLIGTSLFGWAVKQIINVIQVRMFVLHFFMVPSYF